MQLDVTKSRLDKCSWNILGETLGQKIFTTAKEDLVKLKGYRKFVWQNETTLRMQNLYSHQKP